MPKSRFPPLIEAMLIPNYLKNNKAMQIQMIKISFEGCLKMLDSFNLILNLEKKNLLNLNFDVKKEIQGKIYK